MDQLFALAAEIARFSVKRGVSTATHLESLMSAIKKLKSHHYGRSILPFRVEISCLA